MVQKAFENEAMGYKQVKGWFWQFIKVRSSVEGDKCSGRRSVRWNQLMIDKVHSAMLDKRRITITELFDKLGLSFGLVQSIVMEDLDMKCVSVKFVLKLLTVKQKETCLAVARELQECADQDADLMKTIITSDES
jgi:hypothetical protein